MMIERVLSLQGGYVAPWSHCASWSCQRTHHHYIGHTAIHTWLLDVCGARGGEHDVQTQAPHNHRV